MASTIKVTGNTGYLLDTIMKYGFEVKLRTQGNKLHIIIPEVLKITTISTNTMGIPNQFRFESLVDKSEFNTKDFETFVSVIDGTIRAYLERK